MITPNPVVILPTINGRWPASKLTAWIEQHHLKQAEAAEILMVSRPRVSDVVNRKTTKFTIDALVEMLSRIGKSGRLAVG